MTPATRIARLRAANPAAARLALACSLAVRVEPGLLRGLRLLIPGAGADTEADLYFSDLVTARDITAIALDASVARALRRELAAPDHTRLLREAWQLVHAAHLEAHWSVRLEEQVNYLDAARPPRALQLIEDLVLAGLAELARQPGQKGMARWLLGAVARLPADIAAAPVSRAAQAAAGALLDGRAGQVSDTLTPEEGELWLPWLLEGLPTTSLPVRLLNGAVVLGATDPDALPLEGIPQTDPLVVEARWQDGERARSVRVGVNPGEPVRVETGTDTVTLVFLSGLAYRLRPTDRKARFDEPWHAAVKAGLRPCLDRSAELAEVRRLLADPSDATDWVAVWGPPGCGKSVLLVAATDELRARGVAVIEHFFGSGSPERDESGPLEASLLDQLCAEYPDFTQVAGAEPESGRRGLAEGLGALAAVGAFKARPLVIMLDGLVAGDLDPLSRPPMDPVPTWFPPGVRCLLGLRAESPDRLAALRGRLVPTRIRLRPVALTDNTELCRAMLVHERANLARAFAVPLPGEGRQLLDLVDALPGRLGRLLSWLRGRPAGSVELDDIPPSLTVRWEPQLNFLTRHFSVDPTPWLLLLTAAEGRNTWADCADSLAESDDWARFKEVCTQTRLVEPSAFDDLVRLADPTVGERIRELAANGADLRLAHAILADLVPRHPAPLAVELTSRTRLTAAVHHALAADRPSTAIDLCLKLRYLRARYADDPTALVADLAEVADRTGDPSVTHLRQAVHALATAQVPPAAFAAQLHDRLRARVPRADRLDELFTELLARPPLRVSHVLGDHELRGSRTPFRYAEERHLAAGLLGRAASLVLVTPTTARCPGNDALLRIPGSSLQAAVAGHDRIVAWSDGEVVSVSVYPPSVPNLTTLGPLRVMVDFAAATRAGTVLAAADGTVQYLSPAGARRTSLLTGHGARVTAAAQSKALLTLITTSEDGTIRLWDADRGRARVFTDGRGAVRCLQLLHTEPDFVTGGDDGWVRWWDAGRSANSPTARRAGHQGPVLALAMLRDGRVVSASADATLRIWSPTGLDSLVLTGHEDAVTGCLETSRGILSWGADGTVRHWSSHGGPAWEVVRGFPGGIRSVSARGDAYAVLCGDGSVEYGDLLSVPGTPHEGLGGLAITDDRASLTVGRSMVTVLQDGSVDHKEPLQTQLRAMSVASDGQLAVALDTDGHAWELRPVHAGGWAVPRFPVQTPPLTGAALLASLPHRMFALSEGRQVRLGGTARANADTELPDRVTSLAPVSSLDPVDRLVAVGTADGNVHLLHASTTRTVRVFTAGPGPVKALTTIDSRWVAAGGADGTIRLLSLGPSWPAQQLLAHTGAVTALASVGRRLISGGADGQLLLWQPGVPRPLHTVVLDGAVTALAAGDGWLAARDSTGNLWLLELDGRGSLPPPRVAGSVAPHELPDEGVSLKRPVADEQIVAELGLLARADVELSTVTARAGTVPLPIDLWFGLTPDTAETTGTPQPVSRDADGGLRPPLWLPPGEMVWLWAVSTVEPSGPVSVDCLLSSPQLDRYQTVLTYRQPPSVVFRSEGGVDH
ncbi:NACHT and WD repeat domain-containing protein [Kitasatospora sp. NPDC048365]|uniref:NACHT and WD repeat domain-containing protein n=1 Tax=Kitasatospora sp. NPDC048365 TaxID=3364050 RepID=UPI003713D493